MSHVSFILCRTTSGPLTLKIRCCTIIARVSYRDYRVTLVRSSSLSGDLPRMWDCCWRPRPSTSNPKVRAALIPIPSSHSQTQSSFHSRPRPPTRRRASSQKQSQQPRKGNEGWGRPRQNDYVLVREGIGESGRRRGRGEGVWLATRSTTSKEKARRRPTPRRRILLRPANGRQPFLH